MQRTLSLFLCLLIPLHAIASNGIDDVIDRAMQATIAIFPADPDAEAGGGSGVLISPDGFAITNFHVVQPVGPAIVVALPPAGGGHGMAEGQRYHAVVVGLDPVGDIALIKLIGRDDFPYAPFGNSDHVLVGDTAIVMGNPFLLSTDFQPSVSMGIISGVNRYQPGASVGRQSGTAAGTFLEYTDCLQTDAAVNPGNSGGPLFNDRGEIIGIIGRCSFDKRGRVNVGIAFAVSSNQVQFFLGDLKSGRIVDHATLNVVVSTDRQGRVMIENVLGTSDAFRSGLRFNDELLRFGGRVIDSANAFQNILGIFPRDWRVPVTVRGRDGNRHEMLIRLGGLHGEHELIEMTERMIGAPLGDGRPQAADRRREHYIPDAVRPFFEERRGYANFYFNRVELARVLEHWRSAGVGVPAKLTGTLRDRAETFSFQMDDDGIHYTLPLGSGFWNADLTLEDREVSPMLHYQYPRGSGGLFTALYLMRKLSLSDVIDGADIVYTGTAPIGEDLSTLYDVVTVSWRGNEVRFYVDPTTGEMALIEMVASSLDHPSEIYFSGNAMEVRYGRLLFGVFESETPFREPALREPATMLPESATQSRALDPVLDEALQKVVKIYGAAAAGIHGFQSGILISPDGYILTALTAALQANPIIVVLDNGRRFEAQLTAADPIMEIALLKIPGTNLPYFDVNNSRNGAQRNDGNIYLGTPVFAISNPFNIAQGNERATVQRGAVAAMTQLSARRGVFETPYTGDIIIVDIITNNPGANGGALVCVESGTLLGIIGKELRNNENHSWLNFAIPTHAWSEKVQAMKRDAVSDATRRSDGGSGIALFTEQTVRERELIPEDTIRIFQDWGILFITAVSRRTPPFIDAVRSGSEAEALGVLPDDLIVMVNGQLTPSLSAVEHRIHQIPEDQPITLTIERDATLRDVVFRR